MTKLPKWNLKWFWKGTGRCALGDTAVSILPVAYQSFMKLFREVVPFLGLNKLQPTWPFSSAIAFRRVF